MSGDYRPVPNSYPPLPAQSTPAKHRRVSGRHLTILKYVAGTAASLVVLHYVLLGAFPSSSYTSAYHDRLAQWGIEGDSDYAAAELAAQDVLDSIDPSASQPGTFFRDSRPVRTALAFWELAEKEVEARGLNTCDGQISRPLIDAYHASELAYCVPPGAQTEEFHLVPPSNGSHSAHWDPETVVPGSYITCSPVHRDEFSNWWPYPASPCISTNLRAMPDSGRQFYATGCDLTPEGVKLRQEMGTERFIGSDMVRISLEDEGAACEERLERTVLVIGRQDQWNPFHVSEDLITTMVTMFIAARTAPDLVDHRIQLVFAEGYGMDSNHFTPLWDRMGAWAPRRLSLDPWGKGVCLTNAIHSVGAGASLLSAMGVGKSYACASTITWAASHYYRHLFGLLPPSLSLPANLLESHHLGGRPRRPINVLWLSRAKLDAYAEKNNDMSSWRSTRHIKNEPELIDRLRNGLASMCADSLGNSAFGQTGCVFEEAQDVPETWSLTSPESIASPDDPLPVRFAYIDPTVHALETQIHFVGHTTILVSSHGGALGLSLFLPPGDAALLELQVEYVRGNFHFEHMAKEMGHGYEMLGIKNTVNVDDVWASLERWVEKLARSG